MTNELNKNLLYLQSQPTSPDCVTALRYLSSCPAITEQVPVVHTVKTLESLYSERQNSTQALNRFLQSSRRYENAAKKEVYGTELPPIRDQEVAHTVTPVDSAVVTRMAKADMPPMLTSCVTQKKRLFEHDSALKCATGHISTMPNGEPGVRLRKLAVSTVNNAVSQLASQPQNFESRNTSLSSTDCVVSQQVCICSSIMSSSTLWYLTNQLLARSLITGFTWSNPTQFELTLNTGL